MDKKTFISWGVSFGSLALVAGMISYLGLTNTNANNINITKQLQAAGQNSKQQAQSMNSQDNNTAQSSNNHNFLTNVQSFFDTTTGGS